MYEVSTCQSDLIMSCHSLPNYLSMSLSYTSLITVSISHNDNSIPCIIPLLICMKILLCMPNITYDILISTQT